MLRESLFSPPLPSLWRFSRDPGTFSTCFPRKWIHCCGFCPCGLVCKACSRREDAALKRSIASARSTLRIKVIKGVHKLGNLWSVSLFADGLFLNAWICSVKAIFVKEKKTRLGEKQNDSEGARIARKVHPTAGLFRQGGWRKNKTKQYAQKHSPAPKSRGWIPHFRFQTVDVMFTEHPCWRVWWAGKSHCSISFIRGFCWLGLASGWHSRKGREGEEKKKKGEGRRMLIIRAEENKAWGRQRQTGRMSTERRLCLCQWNLLESE